MKTVLQELIEQFERTILVVKNGNAIDKAYWIEKEKQQIIEACIKTTQDCWVSSAEAFGIDLVFTDEDLISQKEEAEQYYKETYGG